MSTADFRTLYRVIGTRYASSVCTAEWCLSGPRVACKLSNYQSFRTSF